MSGTDATGNTMRRLTGFVTAMLAAALANAQDPAPPGEPEPRRYTVEVIIFEYTEQVSAGTEIFEPDPPPENEPAGPSEEFVFEDVPAQPAPEVDEEPEETTDGDPQFTLHTEEEFGLGDVMSRLELLDVYKPTMHFAWTQATLPDEKPVEIDLHSLAEPPVGLR